MWPLESPVLASTLEICFLPILSSAGKGMGSMQYAMGGESGSWLLYCYLRLIPSLSLHSSWTQDITGQHYYRGAICSVIFSLKFLICEMKIMMSLSLFFFGKTKFKDACKAPGTGLTHTSFCFSFPLLKKQMTTNFLIYYLTVLVLELPNTKWIS